MRHILICPFGWLGKNIMPLAGMDGGMKREAGEKTEEEHWRFGGRGGVERNDCSEGWVEKDEARIFSTFPSSHGMMGSHQRGQRGLSAADPRSD